MAKSFSIYGKDYLKNYQKVEEIIREYIDLDDEVSIDPQEPIAKLIGKQGERFEALDLLGLFFNIGIESCKYTSGERLNDRGLDLLTFVVLNEGSPTNLSLGRMEKFIDIIKGNKQIVSTDEVMEYISPSYITRAIEYDSIIGSKPNNL